MAVCSGLNSQLILRPTSRFSSCSSGYFLPPPCHERHFSLRGIQKHVSRRRQPYCQASSVPVPPSVKETLIDDLSAWIWRKIQPPCHNCSPGNHSPVDWLAWLPQPIHEKIHSSEATAILVVKELLMTLLAYSVFVNSEKFFRNLHRAIYSLGKKSTTITEKEFMLSPFHALIVPVQFFTAILFFTRCVKQALPILKIPLTVALIDKLRILCFVAAVTWSMLSWKTVVLVDLMETASRDDKPKLVAADRLSSLLIMVLGFFTAAETLEVSLKSLATFGGITGIAIGLASKEVVTNFFGGLVIWLTRPFVIGEKIKASQFAGTVVDVGFFHTKLLSSDKSLLTIPNQVFTNLVISNISRARHLMVETAFELKAEDISKADRITSRITEVLCSHPSVDTKEDNSMCYVKSLSDGGVNLEITCAVKKMRSAEYYKVKQEILVKVVEILLEEGIEMGYEYRL